MLDVLPVLLELAELLELETVPPDASPTSVSWKLASVVPESLLILIVRPVAEYAVASGV